MDDEVVVVELRFQLAAGKKYPRLGNREININSISPDIEMAKTSLRSQLAQIWPAEVHVMAVTASDRIRETC